MKHETLIAKVASLVVNPSHKQLLFMLLVPFMFLAILCPVNSASEQRSLAGHVLSLASIYFGFAAIVSAAFGRYRAATTQLFVGVSLMLII
jgi:hypothetical protein